MNYSDVSDVWKEVVQKEEDERLYVFDKQAQDRKEGMVEILKKKKKTKKDKKGKNRAIITKIQQTNRRRITDNPKILRRCDRWRRNALKKE